MDDVRERFQNLHEFLKVAQVQAQPQQLGLHRRRHRDRDDARAESASLDSIAFKPRVLRNVQNVDCSTELFGRKIRLPVLIAPVGGLQHVLGRAASRRSRRRPASSASR